MEALSPMPAAAGNATARPALLTTEEVAEKLRCGYRTLQRWRADGGGPPWCKIGPRAVRYPADALEAFISKTTPS